MLQQVNLMQATASAPANLNLRISWSLMKTANASELNAFPLHFVNTYSDTRCKSGTNSPHAFRI